MDAMDAMDVSSWLCCGHFSISPNRYICGWVVGGMDDAGSGRAGGGYDVICWVRENGHPIRPWL